LINDDIKRVFDTAKEIKMKKLLGRLVLSLLVLMGAANGMAQGDQQRDPRQQPSPDQSSPSEARSQRPESERGARDARGAQTEGPRQGRLSPEERQALRRQIDEAGHDIYRPRR
jgi:hypothetical protein